MKKLYTMPRYLGVSEKKTSNGLSEITLGFSKRLEKSILKLSFN